MELELYRTIYPKFQHADFNCQPLNSQGDSIQFPHLVSSISQVLGFQGLLKDCLCQLLGASKDLIAFQGFTCQPFNKA